MGKINSFAFLLHIVSFISLFIEFFIMISRPISVAFFYVFGVSLFVFILSYFFVVRRKKDISITEKFYWYVFFMVTTIFMKIFTSCVNGVNIFNGMSYIFVILLLISFTFLLLWISKIIFNRTIHVVNIILICTYLIFELSELFAYYYIYVHDVNLPLYVPIDTSHNTSIDIPIAYSNRSLTYIMFSIRYFFEFPPQEYVDVVTVLQFIIGKVYEAVLLGGVVSGLSSAFVNKKTYKDYLES